MVRKSLLYDDAGVDFAAMRYAVAVLASIFLLGLAVSCWDCFQREMDSQRCMCEMEGILNECHELFILAPPGCVDDCGRTILEVSIPEGCRCVLGASWCSSGECSLSDMSHAMLPNGTIVTLASYVPICNSRDNDCGPLFLEPGIHHLSLIFKSNSGGYQIVVEESK